MAILEVASIKHKNSTPLEMYLTNDKIMHTYICTYIRWMGSFMIRATGRQACMSSCIPT